MTIMMHNSICNKVLLLCTLLLLTSASSHANQDDPRAHASFYINTYGLVDPAQSPLAKRAYQIFERIHQVAEDPIGVTPTLKIINSDGKPWAIALPDGYIILSRAALEICYQGVDENTGDARLAFVLGHELSHLTSNDFWHRKMYLSLSGKNNSDSLEKVSALISSAAGASADNDWRKTVRNKELRADETGFTYAALAGFHTHLILSDQHGGKDFLNHWVTQTRTSGGDLHFSPTERSDFLHNRFSAIISKVEYFMSGVRLAHFGQYEDAIHFFKEFRNAFPAHEVLNNLGYVNLQLARKHMPAILRYRYWLPTLMESAPPFVTRNRSVGDSMPLNAQRHLKRAVKYLQKAADSHTTHVTSRLNLTTAYLYLEDYHKARATIEEARILAPSSQQVSELRALVLYGQEKEIDMWPIATRILADIDSASALYNLARLHEERSHDETAQHYWLKLLAQESQIPEAYLRIACKKVSDTQRCKKPLAHHSNHRMPLKVKLKIGTDIESPKARKMLQSWQHQHRKIGPLPVDLYIDPDGNSWLAIHSKLSILAFTNPPYQTTRELITCCDNPVAIEPFGDGEIWSYGNWSAVINDQNVSEIWGTDF